MQATQNRSRHDAGLGRHALPGEWRHREAGKRLGDARPTTGLRAAPVGVANAPPQEPPEVVFGTPALRPLRPDQTCGEKMPYLLASKSSLAHSEATALSGFSSPAIVAHPCFST